jgi:hypothetical protein
MEVHAHSHSPRKKWTHYLWEFLMLFLAVFCGFLAEYQLEHTIEHQREKQYMRSMVKDLAQDINNIEADIENRKMKQQIADSMSQLFFLQDYKNNTSYIYYCARRFSVVGYIFHMTDGTLIQLKNSGGLRLIRRQDVVDSLQGYYNLSQQQEDNRELEMLQLRDYRDIMIKVFNVKVFEAMTRKFPVTLIPENNPPLLNDDPGLINDLLMRVHLSKRINLVNIQQLTELKTKAIRLREQIIKEYHLE